MIWKLIKKDLLLRLKNPTGFITLTLLPILFALLLGMIFGPKSDDAPAIQISLLTEDHDDTFVSEFILGAFGRGEMAKMFQVTAVDSGTGRQMMDEGKASALLIIPKGFGDALLDEEQTHLELVKNPSESFAPKIAEETITILAEMSDRFVRLSSKQIRQIRKSIDSDTEMSDAQMAIMAINTYHLIKRVEDILFPPAIAIETADVEEEKDPMSASVLYIYLLAGISIFSLLFMMEALARDFFVEQDNQTAYRLLSGPIRPFTYVISKLSFIYIVGLVSYLLVWIIAIILFGIRLPLYLVPPFLLLILVLLTSLTGIIGMIYSLAANRSQASAIAPACIIFFGLFGGAMIQAEQLPQFMRPISFTSPVYWGQDAVKKLFVENLGIASIWINLAVLGGIGLLLNGLSFLFFERKLRA
ncbi:ABC transporter permease [candidate division KSB1 bacterium]|nr:ABC transporter permease [candidate division KSB1 bacterium]